MPRTVPKIVARLAPPKAKTKSTLKQILRIEKFSPNRNYRAASKPPFRLVSECGTR